MADKALLAGINNYLKIGDLRGCLNDVESINKLLMEQFGFKKSSIKIRRDQQVTKTDLRKHWEWLLKDTSPGDRLIFHFSGHGSYTVDNDGDETDGADELICLYDMDWDNPDSYLLDDELRSWTGEVPEGVHLSVILDSCHSGTGTRMIAPPASKSRSANNMQATTLVDTATSMARLNMRSGASVGSRSMMRDPAATFLEILPESFEQLGPDSVLVRFVQPPARVLERIQRVGVKSGFRRLENSLRSDQGAMDSTKGMRHVLWAGSKNDQTSADAHISGDYHGAFTYYFCELVKAQGRAAKSQSVVSGLRKKLADEGFSQVPQLEPEGINEGLFGQKENSDSGDLPLTPDSSPSILHGGSALPAEFWTQLLATMQSIQQAILQPGRGPALPPASAQQRGLVYVHGICPHKAGYSDAWWNALSPHLHAQLRAMLGANRHEVLWSKHVSPTDRAATVARPAEQREMQAMELRLRDVLRDRASQEVATAIRMSNQSPLGLDRGVDAVGPVPRAVLGIPGLDCVDDFTKYLVFEATRSAVLAEFHNVVRPMLASGQKVDVIAHSWGTVVAFEALRQLDDEGLRGRVGNFFTVGAALSISFIADRLRPRDGRKPTLVDRWINLDATGDIVGGSLQAVGMSVDREHLDLTPTGCDPFGWPLRLYAPACAHSSYFKTDNMTVNRDIFAAAMNSG